MHQINEFISLVNALFKPKNLYILYSRGFRKFFQFDNIFESKNNRSSEAINSSFSKEHKEGSNKSILENLLT